MQKYQELIADVEKKTKAKNWDWDIFQSGIGETIFDRGVLNPKRKEDQEELQQLISEKLRGRMLVEFGGRAYFPNWYGVKTHISDSLCMVVCTAFSPVSQPKKLLFNFFATTPVVPLPM